MIITYYLRLTNNFKLRLSVVSSFSVHNHLITSPSFIVILLSHCSIAFLGGNGWRMTTWWRFTFIMSILLVYLLFFLPIWLSMVLYSDVYWMLFKVIWCALCGLFLFSLLLFIFHYWITLYQKLGLIISYICIISLVLLFFNYVFSISWWFNGLHVGCWSSFIFK